MKNKKIFFLFIFLLLLYFLFSAQDKYLKVYIELNSKTNKYEVYADNSHFIPYLIIINFNILENLTPSINPPYVFVIKTESKKMFLFSLSQIKKEQSIKYSYSYSYSLGDPNAKHDDNYLYIIPFEHGTKRRLSQGFHGKKTHFGLNEYAVDFDMPVGTPIVAARDGIVADVKEDSNVGGIGEYFSDKGNYIAIFHDDGSFAYYVHLKKNGAIVKVGDKVKAGQIIGYSGNTGYSSGPHLHFDIRIVTKDGTMQSIPFKFLNFDNKSIDPKEGASYYSFHPGKPKFDVFFGINIKNEDYENHNSPIPNNNKIEFRIEKIDETILVFIKNGFAEKHEVKIDFSLINLTASKQLPITKVIPPLTEIYLLFLREKNIEEPSMYSIEYISRPIN